jgi:hypothetical protein
MHWLQHFFGFDAGQGNGTHYLFWSGAGSDLGEIAILGAILGAWHRVNCHVKGCWRIGRQHVEGTTYVTCRKHHPEDKPTASHICERYHLYLGKRPGRG